MDRLWSVIHMTLSRAKMQTRIRQPFSFVLVVFVSLCVIFSAGVNYLKCQQRVITELCGAKTALWQRNVTRLMLAAMPDDRTCFSYVFGQLCLILLYDHVTHYSLAVIEVGNYHK